MNFNEALVFGALLIALAIVFAATKDRWNWRKIVISSVGIGVIVSGAFLLYVYLDSRPRPVDTYWDIPLGSTSDDVRFLKGEPTITFEDRVWDFSPETNAPFFSVQFRDGVVWAIYCWLNCNRAPTVELVRVGDPLSAIERHLGQPDRFISSAPALRRTYLYENRNIFFVLTHGRVSSLGIYDPTRSSPNEEELQTAFTLMLQRAREQAPAKIQR